jgi:2-polyprenyl-3-methyl-5-hydroxy-6-metoxy-1,4-benzoquinol methylase
VIPQAEINEAFKKFMSTESQGDRDSFMRNLKYSGYRILDKIGPDDRILDIGCGRNLFKPYRSNVLGIDPVHDEADIKVAFQDFETTEKFDVILCLGSLHFGELEDIVFLTKKLTGMIKPGGKVFWRCACASSIGAWFQYAWTKQLHHDLAKEFGYSIVEIEDDYVGDRENKRASKIYAQWVKDL